MMDGDDATAAAAAQEQLRLEQLCLNNQRRQEEQAPLERQTRPPPNPDAGTEGREQNSTMAAFSSEWNTRVTSESQPRRTTLESSQSRLRHAHQHVLLLLRSADSTFPLPDSTHHHSPILFVVARHPISRHASTAISMAVLVLLLLLATFLPSTALAAFSPAFSFFLACGAASDISFPRDNPARNFTPDKDYLTSSHVPAVTNANANSAASPLYAAARASSSPFSYRLPLPDTAAGQAASFLVLRLHFSPFSTASQSPVSISSARFTVSVLDAYTVLSSFSPPSAAAVVKEFFVPAGGSGDFRITFTPDTGSAAFVNAVELFPAPAELLWNGSNTVTPVGAVAAPDLATWERQALETVHRLNVGGPEVTEEDDTLWRTWLPDGPFLFSPAWVSTVETTNTDIDYARYDSEVAPDVVYKSQRAANVSAAGVSATPSLFNVTWTFPADPGSHYLARLHFCDYEAMSSVVGDVIVFNVFIGQDIGTADLTPTQMEPQVNQLAFYLDYAAAASSSGNLTVSIGMSKKGNGEGGFLNGLEIMKLRPSDPSLRASGSSSGGSKRRSVIIALAAVLGASVLACAVLCFFFFAARRRRLARPAPEEKEGSKALPPWSSPYPDQEGSSLWVAEQSSRSGEGTMQRVSTQLHIPLEELRAATDNFAERNLIGVGGFGNVYRGALRDGTRVAVKRATRASKQGLPEFHTEIVVLSRIRHRHLVSLIGYCNEQAEMILVYEYMEKGTLRSHLYGSGSEEAPAPLPWKQRLEICIGAARGLHYLHTGYSENIIHRDVKSTNILLGEGFIAKVADFGLSRVGPSFGETHVSTAVKGSFGYLDPEYFKTQQLTDRSDVYSFGVVLLEVLCARPVIDQALERDQINLAEWGVKWQRRGQLERIADPRIAAQGPVNDNSLRKFAETAEKCLADYGEDRPSMGDVLWNLEYCLQLQETHVRRDAFEDSGAVGAQFPDDVVVPRWVPSSSSSFLTTADPDDSVVTDVAAADSRVFSQLSGGEGR